MSTPKLNKQLSLSKQLSHGSTTSQNNSKKTLRNRGTVLSFNQWLSKPVEVQAMEQPVEESLAAERETGREQWTSQISFLCATIGSSVGLGNIWRFPALTAKHGGLPFIIAYMVCLIVVGLPMVTLELALGQKFQAGHADAFGAMNPRFRGIGVASACCSYFVSMYYTVILGWAAIYFFESFIPSLPYAAPGNASFSQHFRAAQNHFYNDTLQVSSPVYTDPADITYNLAVANCLKLVGALLFIWLIMYVCIFRGVRWVSHVVKVTMPTPVIIIAILVIYGSTLEGAWGDGGIKAYISDFDSSFLMSRKIWIDAIGQVFFSLGVCMGLVTAYSSHNPKNQNISRDGKIITISDMAVSVLAGFGVYEVIGFITAQCLKEQEANPGMQLNCSFTRTAGFDIAFIAYPTGIALSSASNFWGILFFLCILLLGIDSAFSMIISFTVVLQDSWFGRRLTICGLKRPVLTGGICVVGFLLGFTFLFNNGIMYLDIVDYYINNWCLMLLGFLQTVATGWIYQMSFQFARVGYFSVILYDMCSVFAVGLGLTIALSGNNQSEIDTIWVGVFIGLLIWVFGLVSAVLLARTKGRQHVGYFDKVWYIAGWHGPDMVRRMINKEYDCEWEPNTLKSEITAFLRLEYVSVFFGLFIKYIIPATLLLIIGLNVCVEIEGPYQSYPDSLNCLGILIVALSCTVVILLFIFPRFWYDPCHAGEECYWRWVLNPCHVQVVEKKEVKEKLSGEEVKEGTEVKVEVPATSTA